MSQRQITRIQPENRMLFVCSRDQVRRLVTVRFNLQFAPVFAAVRYRINREKSILLKQLLSRVNYGCNSATCREALEQLVDLQLFLTLGSGG